MCIGYAVRVDLDVDGSTGIGYDMTLVAHCDRFYRVAVEDICAHLYTYECKYMYIYNSSHER